MTTEKKEFFKYKGLPLVRCEDTIYYGNMSDEFVIMMKILDKKEQNGLNVASKIMIYKMTTDPAGIVKSSEKSSLYEALDIAYIWLNRA